MARYFLHLHECGTVYADAVGVELTSDQEARAAATAAARDVMSHEVKRGQLCMSCFIRITDQNDREIERVTFKDAVQLSGV
jgi:hypothetical protein